jgi:hypothetical protein
MIEGARLAHLMTYRQANGNTAGKVGKAKWVVLSNEDAPKDTSFERFYLPVWLIISIYLGGKPRR